jgi:hypothetical protein
VKLAGYLKASDLTKKLRDTLGSPDYLYRFAANRNPAMFFLEERVTKFKLNGFNDFCGTVCLLKEADVIFRYGLTKQQIKAHCKPAILVIDNSEQGRKEAIVYDSLKIERLSAIVPELLKVKAARDAASAKQFEETKNELISQKEKSDSKETLKKQYYALVKSSVNVLSILPFENMCLGDFRCQPVNKKLVETCKEIGYIENGKNKYRFHFKTFELLELFFEELMDYLESEKETQRQGNGGINSCT